MIKSMTGFGRGEFSSLGREYIVEIKTVNHRYLDVSVRLPRQFSAFEDFIRKAVASSISRGKIDVNVQITRFGDSKRQILFDEELIKLYLSEATLLENKFNLKNDLTFSRIIQLQDVVKVSSDDNEEELLKELSVALNVSLNNLKDMRETEGSNLFKDIEKKCDGLLSILEGIEKKAGKVAQEYKEKLNNRVSELLTGTDIVIDDARLATEVAFFADRASIDEEVVRFKSHVAQLLKTIKLNEPIGKKLDFIVQEMNREINTIGSKANDLDITKAVIELKNEIEKIREQIQNIE